MAIIMAHGSGWLSACDTLQTCNEVKAFDTALESLERAHELGLQFFRADAYYTTMKAAALNGRLDVAIK